MRHVSSNISDVSEEVQSLLKYVILSLLDQYLPETCKLPTASLKGCAEA